MVTDSTLLRSASRKLTHSGIDAYNLTRITLFWGKQGLVGIESEGHSGYKDKGEDIVCAAVSSLLHALLLGLQDVAMLEDMECAVDASIPLIRLKWSEDKALHLDLLTRTVALSLKKIASGYAGYVRIAEVHTS